MIVQNNSSNLNTSDDLFIVDVADPVFGQAAQQNGSASPFSSPLGNPADGPQSAHGQNHTNFGGQAAIDGERILMYCVRSAAVYQSAASWLGTKELGGVACGALIDLWIAAKELVFQLGLG